MPAEPVQVAYFYRVKWGHVDEWLELFERNHWPLLRAQRAAGRYTDVRAYVPRFHGDGRGDWNVMITITYRDWAAIEDHTDRDLVLKLYPDQDRFKAEEQRRFELLDAHWDVPLAERRLPAQA
ncbi:MAG: hypothetical protein ACXWNG_06585 [Candidatus Limnocylindrales bacterium]